MPNATKLVRWGNSLTVSIPQSVAKEARLQEGDSLAVEVQRDGSIVLRSTPKRYELAALVSRITPKNRHRETDWGGPYGKEAW